MIELASVIRDLRAELEQAIVAADGAALRFELGPIELEVTIALAHETSTGGNSIPELRTQASIPSASRLTDANQTADHLHHGLGAASFGTLTSYPVAAYPNSSTLENTDSLK
ncbi:trypco2 family protein [Catenulispora subtropica]|uniref:Trypsin-co-occurring domain-containing protein n=1 Tax=Catenulispora subtropica TaxID=450798 RepID=A0ABP5D8T8_9ACTN